MEILKIILPALIVLITAYLLIDRLLKNDEKRRNFDLKLKNTSIVTPIQLRAYERFMLLLERTSPNNLVMSTIKPAMNSLELQSLLLDSIRQELAHNVSQQIYISVELWDAIKASQESLIALINKCASQCKPESEATELAKIIIQIYSSSGDTPTEVVSEMLKKEVRNFL